MAIIAMGVFFVLALFIPMLNREWHPEALMQRVGSGGPVVAGAAFAIAWTPCVGPALGAILGLAAVHDTVAEGGALLAVYSAGLALSLPPHGNRIQPGDDRIRVGEAPLRDHQRHRGRTC